MMTSERPARRLWLAAFLALEALALAAWTVTQRPVTGSTQHLTVFMIDESDALPPAVDEVWPSLLRNGLLLLAVAAVVTALVAVVRRAGAGQLRVERGVALAMAGAAVGLAYTWLAVRHHAGPGSFQDGSPVRGHLAAGISGEVLLILLAVAGAGLAAAHGGRAWYAAAGLALVAGYALASLPGVLDQTLLEVLTHRAGNTAAPQLFLEPGLRSAAPSPVTAGAVLRIAVVLAGVALAVVGAVRPGPGRPRTPARRGPAEGAPS